MLKTYFEETFYDMQVDVAQKYAEGIRAALLAGVSFEGQKKPGFFLSSKRGFEDKLYVGNIHRIEDRLYYRDEQLTDDDQIINVVVVDGPVTRDGDGCSYGSKDHRDQILYANTIPQVVGHVFIINTPGGAASARIDYEQAIADCREKGKPTVAWVDGLCCSAGQLLASLCDRTVVMNGRHTMGCIGTMCAFWGVANNTVDKNGYRYIELVSVTSPDKNAEYREATEGKPDKLQGELDRLGEEFRATVRVNRPLVKEEHLTGKTFDADEVMGELVDEIGDYNRAIECVFELAGQTLTAARLVTAEPDAETSGSEPTEEPEEMSKLNTRPGATMILDEGHVKTPVQTMFGSKEQEIATPQKDNNMTKEQKEAAEVAEQPMATQEEQAPATEQPAEEAPVTEAPAAEENPATEEPAGEETPAQEEAPTQEETPAQEETLAQEEAAGQAEALATAEALVAEKDKEIAELKESLATLEGVAKERDNAIAAVDEAQANVAEAQKNFNEAQTVIAERDKTIAEHVATIKTLNGDMEVLRKDVAEKDALIAGKDSLIEKLTKQVGELTAEVKELSEKPTPMVSAESGVPADNGTGEAPKVNEHQRIKAGMTYKEIRALKKAGKA